MIKTIYCGYSIEGPRQGTYNEYPHCMFLWRNEKLSENYHQLHLLTLKAPITTKADNNFDFFFIFWRKQVLTFHVNHLPSRQFTIKTCFLWKKKKIQILECRLPQILLGALNVKQTFCQSDRDHFSDILPGRQIDIYPGRQIYSDFTISMVRSYGVKI